MKRLVPAYLLIALAAGACDSPSGSGPRVDRVVVTPAERAVNAGDSVRLTAAARDDSGQLISNVTFEWTSLEPQIASVAQTGWVKGLRTGTARIVASARGQADTSIITVFGTAAQCDDPGAGLSLAVGQVVQREGAAGGVLCLEGGADGAEFTVIPFFGSTTAGATLALRATGAGLGTVTGPPSPALAPSVAGGVSPAAARGLSPERDGGFHTRLNQAAREPLARRVEAARQAMQARRTGGPRLSLQQTAPTTGTLLQLNVETDGDPCTATDYRTGRVVAVSDRAVIVADTANPANGFTDADYRHVAASFDTLIYPVNVAAFGAPADLDDNGRVIIFYTRAVNELTPPNANFLVGGFFYGRDLFPRSAQSGFAACAGSNAAEMFYLLAPDPTGVVNGNVRTAESVRMSTLATVGHELQHLISASRRLYVVPGVSGANWNEEVYLNEGLSHIAEELLFYHRAGLSPRQNLGREILAPGTATRAAFLLFGEQNEGRYGEYLRNPETNSPYEDDDELAVRGAAWAFLRYVADRRNGNDAQLWFDLVNNNVTGLANLTEVLGQNPLPLFRDFVVSVYTDDAVPGIPAIFTQPSWNHRSLWQNVGGGFPLRVRPLTSGAPVDVTLTMGGAAYLRAAVPAGRRGSVQLNAGGGPLPSTVTVNVVRTR